jgi:hypothetical protein
MRIRERQQELARFARDITRMTAEIIAENFAPEVMAEMSQTDVPSMAEQQQAQMFLQQVQEMQAMAQQAQQAGVQLPPPPIPPKDAMKKAEKAVKSPTLEDLANFLRNDRARGFVIEIETDSTIAPDEDAEKGRRIEFAQVVGGLFQQAVPIVLQAPMLGPATIELVRFTAAAFRAGRSLEATLDQLQEQIEGLAEKAMQPAPPPQPDPTEMLKLEGQKEKTKADIMKAQGSMQQTQMNVQAHTIKTQNDLVRMQAEAAAEAATPTTNSINGSGA